MPLDFQSVIAILSVVVPLGAFVWEFAIVRRKRLGYRVQMDTLLTGKAGATEANVLVQMYQGDQYRNPSLVLLRVENAGWTEIREEDYLAPVGDVGMTVLFPDRKVVGMAVPDYSQDELHRFFYVPNKTAIGAQPRFVEAPGFESDNEGTSGLINLPKVKLNPGEHYKVLVLLERWTDDGRTGSPPPRFRAALSGPQNRWFKRIDKVRLARTESHTFASRPALVGIGLLAVAVLVQSSLALFLRDDPAPLDCVGGTLYLHGSTAFGPSVRAAAERYAELCSGRGAKIPLNDATFQGSTAGITALEKAGEDAKLPGGAGLGDHIAFTDGPVEGSHAQLLARPVVYSLFTLVANKQARVNNLSTRQIRDIYAGRIANWSEVGGADLPIHLVSRHRGSGTRTALVERVLTDGTTRIEVPEATVNDCAAIQRDQPGHCETDSTETLLREVADIPGALGHSEVSSAATAGDVVQVRIDQAPATLTGVEDGRYPYWQTEFAYTYGELPADSIGAAFLRYLTDQGGKDILREHGNRPCSETEFPLMCRPT
ncbi:phosphate-binding protein [Actinoplanes capillaceus]|uniref:Phosphate-binding protein n=1 Tax=Actinoplanes campanulatus TaxID=113559 RepID=A0ABQ3WNX5_9ACTN|nr:substrate-binding domain-containing protein [Actinoplanes capillaceus]GID47933.1 phosphate-binding protein [Actinoplanes capillaceus]